MEATEQGVASEAPSRLLDQAVSEPRQPARTAAHDSGDARHHESASIGDAKVHGPSEAPQGRGDRAGLRSRLLGAKALSHAYVMCLCVSVPCSFCLLND